MRINILITIFLLYGSAGFSKTINVCKTCDIKEISQAIEIANEGDSIVVQSGVYKESGLTISKSIHLVGKGNPVLDGEFKNYILIFSDVSNFSISGFTLRNVGSSYIKDYAAILVQKGRNFTIRENIFEDVFFGLLIEKSVYGLISKNTISSDAKIEANSGNGIHLWHCKKMRVEGNTVFKLRDGIYLEFVSGSFIYDNVSRDNIRYGLHFMFSDNNEYHHNEFKSNDAGVAVMFSKFIKMHHNTFHYNWGTSSYGLLLKEIYDAEIDHNYFEQNTTGINIDGCTRINYQNNHFVRNGWAVKFTGGCYKNIFTYNNFVANSFNLSYNSKLNDNLFEANYWSDYTGYDLDKDGIGDIPYHPVNLFSYIVNQTPESLILLRSLFIDIVNFSEKVSPVFTQENLQDRKPIMKKINDRY